MNPTVKKILASRPDLSEYLYHFTKGSSGKKTLEKILQDEKLIDVKELGRICFSEAPLLMLDEMFKIFDAYSEPMYSRYGIAIKKSYLFEKGARPVIYGTADELLLLDNSLKWRFEQFDLSSHDFSWLREWRICSDSVILSPEHCFIIADTNAEINALTADWDTPGDIQFDGCVSDGVYQGQAYYTVEKYIKGVSFEQLRTLSSLSPETLRKELDVQHLGEVVGRRSIGGFSVSSESGK